MTDSMITQLTHINRALEKLSKQLDEEKSSFRFYVSNACDNLKRVEKQYHEVLERDAREDAPYIKPTLTEVTS